jgi:hypothetical protein
VLDLDRLLPTDRERRRFEDRWPEFLTSDPANSDIYRLIGDRLIYLTEHLVPTKTDDRPPLLLVLGNPASHSVRAGMFFSFEARDREHRFWKTILRPAGVLDLALDDDLPVEERNVRRRDRILNLDYDSPFRVGLTVFISMASAASGTWSGVAGVNRLIGAKALRRLEAAERERIMKCARNFVTLEGKVVAFQKNAWQGLRSQNSPHYRVKLAKAGKLRGTLHGMPEVRLIGVPPTRLTGPAQRVLRSLSHSQ